MRQLFRRGGGKPVVVATLLDGPDAQGGSLEFLNEGGPANGVECLAQVVGRVEHVTVGSLATGEVKSVAVGPLPEGDFKCVWACSDAGGRTYVWSYDGRGRRLGRDRHTVLQEVFRELYPASGA